jgi:hypothetical protein
MMIMVMMMISFKFQMFIDGEVYAGTVGKSPLFVTVYQEEQNLQYIFVLS